MKVTPFELGPKKAGILSNEGWLAAVWQKGGWALLKKWRKTRVSGKQAEALGQPLKNVIKRKKRKNMRSAGPGIYFRGDSILGSQIPALRTALGTHGYK